ncbi:hypothetical protein [Acutalibacter caecimuris]|uniref:hypothetical protein n=1 Tax=Acutalibacter caecimuris TaxID=3093657 RepID=UPI002AC9B7B6|nr:hypothetical protein [Acutalibacter sp. M00118]
MQNRILVNLRAFPVKVTDTRDGKTHEQLLVLDKAQLQAAQIVGQSSRELIERICTRQGFKVQDIGTPRKRSVAVDLTELYTEVMGVED